jgi:hypothetical protein
VCQANKLAGNTPSAGAGNSDKFRRHSCPGVRARSSREAGGTACCLGRAPTGAKRRRDADRVHLAAQSCHWSPMPFERVGPAVLGRDVGADHEVPDGCGHQDLAGPAATMIRAPMWTAIPPRHRCGGPPRRCGARSDLDLALVAPPGARGRSGVPDPAHRRPPGCRRPVLLISLPPAWSIGRRAAWSWSWSSSRHRWSPTARARSVESTMSVNSTVASSRWDGLAGSRSRVGRAPCQRRCQPTGEHQIDVWCLTRLDV